MSDLLNVCLIGIIVIAGLLLLSRLMGSANRGIPRGNYAPRYDDPDIESRGGFGNYTPGDDNDPRSGFGGTSGGKGGFSSGGNETPKGRSGFGGFSAPRSGGSSSPRNDSPSIRSRGGFGRNKKG